MVGIMVVEVIPVLPLLELLLQIVNCDIVIRKRHVEAISIGRPMLVINDKDPNTGHNDGGCR